MSCVYVRQLAKAWANQVGVAVGCKFYDTVNLEQNPKDRVWFTLAYWAERDERTFCDDNYMEEGSITIVVAAKPGTGDIEALTALEKIVPAMYAKTDARLAFESWEPGDEESGGSADRHYRVSAVLNYRHSSK